MSNSDGGGVKKTLGGVAEKTTPVSKSATSETEESDPNPSETEIILEKNEDKQNLERKIEKVSKYDRDYIWGLIHDQFRQEVFQLVLVTLSGCFLKSSTSMY